MNAVRGVKWLAACLLGLGLAAGASAQTTVRYVHTDALGSVVALTDQNRVVVERREYEPYGQQLTPAVADGPGYTGHVQDAASGLTYMQQRYYDPQIGRFLSVDPISADSNTGALFNRYWYADNNPYRYYDPDGRCTGSRIENADGTCKMTGDFTTQAPGPTMKGAKTVVQQASIEQQLRYNRDSALAQLFPLPQWMKNVSVSDLMHGHAYGSREHCEQVPQACHTPVDDMMENYYPTILTIASFAYGGQVPALGRQVAANAGSRAFSSSLLGPSGSVFGRKAMGGRPLITGDALRVGWGWKGSRTTGNHVFRISGEWVEAIGVKSGHIDIFVVP